MPQVAKEWYNNVFCSLFWGTFFVHVATLQSIQTSQRGYLHFNVCSIRRGMQKYTHRVSSLSNSASSTRIALRSRRTNVALFARSPTTSLLSLQ